MDDLTSNDAAREEQVRALAQALAKLLQENLPLNAEEAREGMDFANRLKAEIESMGYLVTWHGKLDLETLGFNVTVDLFKPRDGLSPELQKAYHEWLAQKMIYYQELCGRSSPE